MATIYWNDERAESLDGRSSHGCASSAAGQIRRCSRSSPERRAPYERVAQVLAAAQRAHVTRLTVNPVADTP